MSKEDNDIFDDERPSNKAIKLYRKNEKNEVNLKEISRGMYSDSDSFEQALDFWYGEGYYDTYKEAQEAPTLSKNNVENTNNESIDSKKPKI